MFALSVLHMKHNQITEISRGKLRMVGGGGDLFGI